MMKKVWLWIVIAVVISGSLGGAGYFYFKYQEATGNSADKEAKEAVSKVGKIMVLPDELPSVATVIDKQKVNAQKFFKNAENGDKVLMYPLASKAILYRPAINKIVEVASITQSQTVDATPTTAVGVDTPIGPPKIVLYNGTTNIGLSSKVEKKIVENKLDIEISGKEMAVRNDYQQTVVVDLSGKFTNEVNVLAKFLSAKIVKLPSGEASPNADIAVILGKDAI